MSRNPSHSTTQTFTPSRSHPLTPSRRLRGFSLVELLIALAIVAALLTATLVALNASFMAYQATTEVASTHTIGRLTMHRMLSLIRTGDQFGPFPTTPLQSTVRSDFIEFMTPNDDVLTLVWKEDADVANGYPEGNALYVVTSDGGVDTPYLLLEGVVAQYDDDTPPNRIKPFTMEFAKGRVLYRATIDLTIKPDDNMSVMMDGQNEQIIRLVASAMPRLSTF
jgi:prepilin-type N-terminal cleavage/methylation domain-containing protein